MHLPGTEAASAQLVAAVEELPGVRWVAVNAVLGRVVVDYDPEVIDKAELIEAVEQVSERQARLSGRTPQQRRRIGALRLEYSTMRW